MNDKKENLLGLILSFDEFSMEQSRSDVLLEGLLLKFKTLFKKKVDGGRNEDIFYNFGYYKKFIKLSNVQSIIVIM